MLMLSKGCTPMTRNELENIPTPPASGRHRPVPHAQLADILVRTAERRGLSLCQERYGVTHDGMRLYGALDFDVPRSFRMPSGITPSLGIRHANDKTLSVQLTCGTRVLVCDNGCLIGELETTKRKHTSGLNLQDLVGSAIDEFMLRLPDFHGLYDRLTVSRLTDNRAKVLLHDMFLKHRVMALKYMEPVSQRYFHSEKHRKQFPERNRWALYNSVTETMKAQSVALQSASYSALAKAICN